MSYHCCRDGTVISLKEEEKTVQRYGSPVLHRFKCTYVLKQQLYLLTIGMTTSTESGGFLWLRKNFRPHTMSTLPKPPQIPQLHSGRVREDPCATYKVRSSTASLIVCTNIYPRRRS